MSLLAILAALAVSGTAEPPVFTPAPCAQAELVGKARCGAVEVPEDRAAPGGRRIRLNVVVLPSLAPERGLVPQYDLEGGPGMPATQGAAFYLTLGAAYREREIVLIDQRGTGRSNPLHCPELDAIAGGYAELYPREVVRRCRRELESRADLRRYTTAEAAADLDAVREALGHERINLFALSYGTTLALHYMRDHPQRVRAAVLWGAAPPSGMPPRDHAPNAEHALSRLFADCAADPACAKAYPQLPEDWRSALARLPASGSPSRETFAENLRSLMYTPSGYRKLPRIIHGAAVGDLGPFRAATGSRRPSPAAGGLYLSVTCSESLAVMDYAAAAAASRATQFGDYRLRRQREACLEWPASPPPPAFYAPTVIETPILLVSGDRDPVTPVAWATELRRRLPHSGHVVVPHGGHLFDGLSGAECVDELILAFYAAGSADDLDAACLAKVEPPAFDIANP